jgi:RHS repeat-associated protein
VRNVSNYTTTLTTPQLADTSQKNDIVFTFNSFGQETSRKVYANTPGTNLLRAINTTWASNGTPASQVIILEDGSTQSETDTTFDSNGLLDSMSEYDWGSGSRGNLIRTTTLTFNTSPSYTSRNIIDLVTSKVIKDGSGTVQYRQDTSYDDFQITNCPTGVPQHDDTDFPCTMNYRGNPTTVTTYLQPAGPSGGISKTFTYDVFGNLITAQLNCCQQKTWNYSAATEYSEPDSIVRGSGPQLTTSYTYNIYTGQMETSTDENNQTTHYYYDFLRRPTSVVRPDNSTVFYTYNDAAFTTTIKTPIDSSNSVQQITAVDALGRAVTATTEDGNNTVYSEVSTEYDLAGRAYGTSNPYTGSPSYWTTTSFDALGRSTKVTLPDNSATTYSYATNTVTVTDPAGKERKAVSDAAGRLSAVYEPDPSNGNSLTNETSYTYTVLDKLATVTEGSQTRTYSYDALGRLTSAALPEAEGVATTFTYDNYDNLLTRTDPRNVVTTYGYDGLNRLTGVGYTIPQGSGVAATASVSYTFGTNPSQNNNGRLITMTDGVGSENYTYNNLGELTRLQKVINGTTYTTSYQYNEAAELTQITYPSGRVVQQSVDPVGRLCAVGASGSSCSSGTLYASGFGYNAASQATGFKYGNGIYASLGYSADRLQLTCLDYSTTNRNGSCTHDSATKFGLSYIYGSAGSNDGQISGITDSVDNGRSVAYTYDALARLVTAVTTGSANYPQWGLRWNYDRYGNRTDQIVTAGTAPSNSVTVDGASNRIISTGYGYDANGNMTNDGNNTLVYDGENRVTSSSGNLGSGTYTYDGNGLRVKKISGGTTTVYIFSGAKVIAEYENGAVPSSPTREYLYVGAALLAKIESGSTTYYQQDHLSNRLLTDNSGNVIGQSGHFPYGEQWYAQNTTTKWAFTTYERDAESGNDYAMAREYVNRLGRFSTPDPLAGDAGGPQTLNRYPYTLNDPINLADPSGLCGEIVGEGSSSMWTGSGFEQVDSGPIYAWIENCTEELEADLFWAQQSRDLTPPTIGGGGGRGRVCGPIGCLAPPKLPAPPPGYDLCKKGLKEDKKGFDSVQRALDNWDTIKNAADANSVNPAMLAAVGIVESGFKDVNEKDGAGVGVGVFQITVSANSGVTAAQANNLTWAANYAGNMLSSNMHYLAGRFPKFTATQLLQATAASYNLGPGGISGNPATIDEGSKPNGNYGALVLLIMNCF